MTNRRKVIVGDVFGKLVVVETWVKVFSKSPETVCRCSCECGNTDYVTRAAYLVHHNKIHCGCVKKPIGKDNPTWKGYEEISKRLWNNIKRRGNKFEFTITMKYAWDLFIQQERKCALTGVELYFPERADVHFTASLDRIDSTKGYIEGNVQWVHRNVNLMKWDFNQDYFINWCKTITEYNKGERIEN